MSVGLKIIVSFVTAGLVVAALALLAIAPIRARLSTVGDFHAADLALMLELQADTMDAVQEAFAYVVSGDEQERDEFLAWPRRFDDRVARFEKLEADEWSVDDAEARYETALLDHLKARRIGLVESASRMFADYRESGSVTPESFTNFEDHVDSIAADLTEFVSIERRKSNTDQALVLETLRTHTAFLVLIALGALVLAIAFGAVLARTVSRSILGLEQMKDQLEVLATTDTLTGLLNRTVLLDRLGQSIRRSHRDGSRFAILFFDLDRFKVVNDSLGHDVGDALLCSIAETLRAELRASDSVARLGGDEFVVLLEDLTEWSDAEDKAQRMLEALARPHVISGHQIVCSASVGLVTNERDYGDSIEVLRDADAAMYQAKAAGRATAVRFDREMHERAIRRISLESDLRLALAGNQLRLAYQPIVELDGGGVSGFEALIRWDHPEFGLINPSEFIPIAEETGVIVDIGAWALRSACVQIADWNRRLGLETSLTVSVNVSKRQLVRAAFFDDVADCLRELGLQPRTLNLEITESVVSDGRHEIPPLLVRLRDHGVQISMDDFGTGVSSLSSLHDYPIGMLKIDRSFVLGMDTDHSLRAVVASVTALANSLEITTVAEGIETASVLAELQEIGCTWGQGFYFGKPMSPADAESYLLRHRGNGLAA